MNMEAAIDDMLKCLEELENQAGQLSAPAKYHVKDLKFGLRYVRIHLKWNTYSHSRLFLASIRLWIRGVGKRLIQPIRDGSMATDHLLEEILQSLLINNQSEHIGYHSRYLNNFLCRQSSEYLKKGFSSRRVDYKEVLIHEHVKDWFDPLLENLKHLIHCNDLNLPSLRKEQIKDLEERLIFIRNFLEITWKDPETMNNFMPRKGLRHKTLEDLLTWVKMFVQEAIYMTYELWIQRGKLNRDMLFFDVLGKINHIELEIRMIYAQFLNASKTEKPGTLGTDLQALVSVDSLLGSLDEWLKAQDDSSTTPLDAHQLSFLHQELSFLRYFLIMDPKLKQHTEPEPESFNSLLMQLVEAMAREATSLTRSICVGQKKDDAAKEMNLVHSNLLEIVNLLKAKIKQMYLRLPKPAASDFPWTPKLGFLDFFTQNLEELLKHRADSIAYVKNEIETVQSELASLRPFMIKNSEKDENAARRIMDVVHEAERVIDLISASHFPRWYYVLWLSDVIEKMKRLSKESTEVCSKEKGDISELNLERASVHVHPLPCSLAPEDEMVGFNDQVEKIIDQLIVDSKKFDIVSIVGMPGLGKTTLAKKVYTDPSITRHFQVCSWYCISQEYRKRDLLLRLLGDVTRHGEEFQEKENEEMEEELCKSLRGRRYLVVLDDLWSIESWHDIQNSFPDDYNGSRILFTTRNQDVALQANRRTCAPHDLRLFTDEESWELLQKKVFQGPNCPRKLYAIGKQIAENCKGLPLLVVVVAGILKRMEEHEDHWRQISKSLVKQVVGDSRDIIELSYKYLPDHLKPCFLYLGVFPEDKEIPVSKLIQLWIAEGLVQKTASKSLEKVAEGYLRDLIGRSLVLVGKNKWNGGIKSCHLHDLLHEFSREKARDEKFFLLSKHLVKLEELGHCLYCENDYFYEGMPDDSYVRSISCLPYDRRSYLEVSSYILFSALPYIFKLLRVLDVEGFCLDSFLFPTEIILLVHLRYLSIGGAMSYVPSSIENLWRLETFRFYVGYNRVGYKREVKLPETLLKMAHLKHVHVTGRAAFALSGRFPLTEKSFKSNIQNFSTLAFRRGEGTTKKIITCLKDLKKLKCIFLESWDSDRCCNHFPVLDLLSKLESLNVTYHGMVKHPCKFNFPSTLKKLTLSEFCLPWREISKIGRLVPQLEALKLLFRACEGPRWDVSDGEFCNLKVLKLQNPGIVKWNASDDAFPCLEKLVLQSCRQLKEVPSSFEALATLRMIEVRYCSYSAAKAVQKIQQEQEVLGNDGLKVIIHPGDWISAPDS